MIDCINLLFNRVIIFLENFPPWNEYPGLFKPAHSPTESLRMRSYLRASVVLARPLRGPLTVANLPE
jgi:hypothetical protein